MAKFTITTDAPGWINPFHDRPSQRGLNSLIALRNAAKLTQDVLSGAGIARRQKDSGRTSCTVEYGLNPAIAGVTVAAPATSATITINGQALTAAEHRANCTVTVGTSVDEDDTVTVNGVVFTAKAAPSGNYQWAITGVAATDASALVTKINACFANGADAVNGAGVYGLIKADRPAADGVVNIFAVAEGTAGNSYTIATSDAVDLAITNDNSGSFAGGLAATNNQFDHIGDNATIARAVVACANASSTDIVSKHVKAACRRGTVTCSTVVYDNHVVLDSVKLRAIKETTDSGGNRVTTFPDDVFGIGASDTATGACLANCINNHPKLRERFYATAATGTVTIRERPPEATSPPPLTSSGATLAISNVSNGCLADSALVLFQATRAGHDGNAITIASSSGTTLAIDGSASRLAGGTSTTITV